MNRRLLLYLASRSWMRQMVSRYKLSRNFAWRFVAGEDTQAALEAVRELGSRGILSTLDLLGESVHEQAEAERAANAYLQLLDDIRESGEESYISIKLTQLGLDIDTELCVRNLRPILDKARTYSTFVRFDMEGSKYTQQTLDIFYRLHEEYDDHCGVVIQSYLYRSLDDVEKLNAIGGRVRLCKGAYLEPSDIAYQSKDDVDANYLRLMERLLLHGRCPAIATHDVVMINHARRFTQSHGIPKSAFEFQMLYGVRRDLQERLAAEGYRIRCYIPFGTEWYPYFMRRLAERPANLMFVMRNLVAENRKR